MVCVYSHMFVCACVLKGANEDVWHSLPRAMSEMPPLWTQRAEINLFGPACATPHQMAVPCACGQHPSPMTNWQRGLHRCVPGKCAPIKGSTLTSASAPPKTRVPSKKEREHSYSDSQAEIKNYSSYCWLHHLFIYLFFKERRRSVFFK